MATLREMLVKIYQPRQGIIEFGPAGQSTQDGATGLSVLGGGPNQASSDEGQGGTISVPEFRYAGMEGGGGGGGGAGGGIDWSSIDWNDPAQVQRVRDYLEREGGQAGEPGGGGAGGVPFGDPNAYVDPTLAELVSYFAPGPIGLVGSLGAAGMRGHNAGLLDDELGRAGFSGLSLGQMLGAIGGFNSYGAGDPRDTFGAQGIGGLAEAAYGAQTARGVFDSINDPAMGVSANQRARSDTRGGAAESSSYGGTREREGRSAIDRHSAGNRGGGGAESGGGGRGGGGGFGCFVGDTPILMADGSRKKIKDIREGDMVMAFEGRSDLQPRRVAATMRYTNRDPIRVYYGEGHGVVVTREHPFLTENGEYKTAGELRPGDLLVNAEGLLVKVLEINTSAPRSTVYNFEVEDLHTYVAKGLRVHNIKHDGGMVPGMPGEEVDEVLLAGEYVMTPEAVEMVGPDTFAKINNLARMMRQQHYPAR